MKIADIMVRKEAKRVYVIFPAKRSNYIYEPFPYATTENLSISPVLFAEALNAMMEDNGWEYIVRFYNAENYIEDVEELYKLLPTIQFEICVDKPIMLPAGIRGVFHPKLATNFDKYMSMREKFDNYLLEFDVSTEMDIDMIVAFLRNKKKEKMLLSLVPFGKDRVEYTAKKQYVNDIIPRLKVAGIKNAVIRDWGIEYRTKPAVL